MQAGGQTILIAGYGERHCKTQYSLFAIATDNTKHWSREIDMEQPDKSLDDFAMWRFCDLHIAGDDCPYCRITELETQNKILSDSIMAGTNVYKRQLKNAETESSNRGRALKEIIRLASEYTTGG